MKRIALIVLAVLVGAFALAFVWRLTSDAADVRDAETRTRDAQAVLEQFFTAWSAEDESTLESLLAKPRQGMEWQFDKLESVEFGPIKHSPEDEADYLTKGLGSTSGAVAENVRCFRADVTFSYVEPIMGAPEGEPQRWKWYVELDEAGEWHLTDWGY